MPSQTVRGLSIALETEREAYQRQANIEELIERIGAVLSQDGGAEPIPGLRLHRVSRPTQLHHGVYEPSFCVIAQGSKEVFLGRDRYRYDPAHYLLARKAWRKSWG